MQYLLVHNRAADAASPEDASSTSTPQEQTLPQRQLPAMLPSTSKNQGHRRHKRARADELLVKVRVGDGTLIARVEDISVGGLFARTQRAIPVGAFVELALLRPGHDELPLTGIVVDDTAKRAGLAVRFENVTGPAAAALRRVVLDAQVKTAGDDPDVDVTPTRIMAAPSAELVGRDREIEELRRKVALLTAENERLRAEVAQADEAHKLVGRLQLEIDRLKGRVDGRAFVEAELLTDIKRDAEQAWMAIARVSDALEKLK